MDNEKILTRIKNLLDMANDKGSTQNEVETAIAMAQKLMIENNLSMSEFDLEEEKLRKKELHREYTTKVGMIKWWVKDLNGIIGKNFKCTSVLYDCGARKSQMGYVGLKEDVDLACMVFKFTVEHCESCAENYIEDYIKTYNKTRRFHLHITKVDCKEERKMFIKGFVLGVRHKLEDQVKKNNWGLMIVKDAIVLAYEEDKKSVSTRRPDFKNVDNGRAYNEGYKRGKESEYSSTRKLS